MSLSLKHSPMHIFQSLLIIAALMCSTSAFAADAKKSSKIRKFSVAVMDIQGSAQIDEKVLQAVGATVTQELVALGAFKAVSLGEIRQMISMEAARQAADCESTTCMVELAGAVGAEFSISGNLLKFDDALVLQLQLINTREAKTISRLEREHRGSPSALFQTTRTAVKVLVRDLLAKKSGTLKLNATETGATVRLDNRIIGTTPLQPIQAAGGTHTLSIEKKGFVIYSKDIDILSQEATDIQARLLPSEEYKRNYLRLANASRRMAWSGVGVAAAGFVSAISLAVYSASATKELNSDIDAYNADSVSKSAQGEADLRTRGDRLGTYNTLAWVSAGLGIAGAATGASFFLLGEDPNHFDAKTTTEVGDSTATFAEIKIGLGQIVLQGRF